MQATDWASAIVCAGFGAVTGSLLGGSAAAILGALLGGTFALGAARARVRPMFAMTVFVGAATGVLIGSSIVETICLPDTCVGLEATGGVVVGIASMIGVGMVAALVARSFDEYNDSVAKGEEPPSAGCESGQ